MYVIIIDARAITIGPFTTEEEALDYKRMRFLQGVVRQITAPV